MIRKILLTSAYMKLDLPLTENWEQLNDAAKVHLKIPSPLRVRVFKDLSSAVLEIAQGTAQFFSHKKSLGFVKGQTPAFEFLLPYFYKEAYQIKQTSYLQLSDIKAWVDSLNKDTSFVIFAEDHPVTGELYDFCDELDHLLNEKRIYSLRISHARFGAEELAVRPYSVRICSWAEDLAIAVCGERFRSPPLVAHRQHWNKELTLALLEKTEQSMHFDQNLVQSFEQKMAADQTVSLWFQKSEKRLWDRSVVGFTQVSAEALAENLFAKLQLPLPQAWEKIETTNMCRWNSVRMYNTWWEPLPQENSLRGLLIFSAGILNTKDFANLVLSSYEEIKTLQTWS